MFPEDKPQSRSPRQRPRSPAVLAGYARGAQLPPLRESRRSCSNYRPYSISDLFAFNAEYRLFLSPHVVSPSHTHSHRTPSLLPPSLLLSGKRQWDGTVHLQESSLCHARLFSGPRRSRRSCWGGSGQEGGEALSSAGRRPPASRPGSSVQVPVLPPLADRSQLMLSRRLSVSPISSHAWPAAAPRSLLEVLRAAPHAAQPLLL